MKEMMENNIGTVADNIHALSTGNNMDLAGSKISKFENDISINTTRILNLSQENNQQFMVSATNTASIFDLKELNKRMEA